MAHGASHAALGTMRHWLLGLELWHHINGAPWFGAHALTRAVKAPGHLTPPKSQHPPHALVTIDHLCSLLEHLNFDDPFDTAVYGTTCLTFWSQAWLGELNFEGSFDPLHHASRHSMVIGAASSGRWYGKVWLPQTKMKP